MNKDRIVMIGSGCIDEYYELSYVPEMGEKTICKPLKSIVGGMIGNAAAVAASYGMDTYLMDTMNQSANSQLVLDDCRKQNIGLELMRYDDTLPDVKCIIFLKDGERIIYVIPTQKKDIEIDQAQEEIIREAAYIYSTTAEIRCFKKPVEVMDLLKRNGSKIVLDIEYLEPSIIGMEWELIRRADIIFVNSEGDRQLTEMVSEDYISTLNQNGCMAVRTKGGDGCTIYDSTGSATDIPAYRVSLVDTTGAGDTFNSSFIFGISQGWSIERAGNFANAAAAQAIQFMGARSGAVGVKKVEEFLNTYKEEVR